LLPTTRLPRRGVRRLFVDIGVEVVEINGGFVVVVAFTQHFFPVFARASV
jgi:hypothetical protein